MTLDTILENLDRTIEGKTSLLAALEGDGPMIELMKNILLVNIMELQRIKDDVTRVKNFNPLI